MEQTITYTLKKEDFSSVLKEQIEALAQKALLGRYTDTLISASAVAEIHGVHRETVLRHANGGDIEFVKIGKLYKFSLAYVLELDFNSIKYKK